MASVARAEEVEVRMLAVDEAARGRGVADRLMAACEALARDEGRAAVVLSTAPDMHAAHRLYRRRGYVRQPDRDWSARTVDPSCSRRSARRSLSRRSRCPGCPGR